MTNRAWTRIAVLVLLWGSAFLWIKVALDDGLSPLQVAVARSALGVLALVVVARMRGRRLPRDRAAWGRLAFCNARRLRGGSRSHAGSITD